jgi:hypothetical protein
MENSQEFLDDAAQWYFAFGEKWVGPLTASQIHQRIASQEISWAHFIWRKGQSQWLRICDTPSFQSGAPCAPKKKFTQVHQAARVIPSERKPEPAEIKKWFLYVKNAQYGPFSVKEVLSMLQAKKIDQSVHAWCRGMQHWEGIERLPDFFTKKPSSAQSSLEKNVDRRGGQLRKPLVAQVFMTDDQEVVLGLCRDISVGGLQILTEEVPGEVGTRLKVNVSPSGKEKDAHLMFTARGTIVRILEDGRGFSFRFDRLSEKSKRIIEKYIELGDA